MKPKLLVLASPEGDAMLRDVFEHCAALAPSYALRALVPRAQRARFAALGIETVAWRPAGIIGMGRAVATLRAHAGRFAPDIVHAHGFPAVAVALGTFPLSLAARTIATFHDPQRDKELPRRLVDKKLPAYLRRAAHVIATYPSLARALERRLALDALTVDVIPHGVVVPPAGAVPLERPPARRGPVVGWNGRLSADRAWETAIDALGVLRATLPGATLRMAGSGGARQFVAAHARRMKLAGAVTFVGESAPAEFFAAIDLLAVPISRDAQPHAPLEALAWGIPVVAANAGALADAVGPNETGWLVPDDAAGFAEGIADAWSRIDAAWTGAARQRDTARATYDRDAITAGYVALYERMLTPPSRRPPV